MTDTQKILEEFDKGAVGKNVHSVYVYCNSCFSWGVNLPLEKECGNCGNTEDAFTYYDAETITLLIQEAIAEERERVVVTENTSDGYHTFKELYDFRKIYNAVLFNEWTSGRKYQIHKSKKHSDGEECFGGGWFIVIATLPTGQISNHYELKDWDLFRCEERELADKWDGHTSQDVLTRLASLPLTDKE